jgi:N-acetylglucosaminyl-diphospho-decaprenol L-rhamnosyltransferase
MLSIDVVVPTYNRWDLTEACLAALADQSVEHTVIVSDDGSADNTPARASEAFPQARVVTAERNSGFAAACNLGVAAGSGELVVLLNNDVQPRRDFLERLVEPLERDQRLGSAAALLVKPDERTIDSVGLTADPTLAGFPRLAGLPVPEAGRERPVLVGPTGGAAAYRRAAWEAAGGLDETIGFYLEDLDLALRLQTVGWGAVAAPDAVGVHLGSATIGARSRRTRYSGGFARGYLLRRYGVLRGRKAVRAAATEAIVSVADLARSRDLAATSGRLAGWRAAAGTPARAMPPHEAIDDRIGFVESLRLRRSS